jgi:hypothetical protein
MILGKLSEEQLLRISDAEDACGSILAGNPRFLRLAEAGLSPLGCALSYARGKKALPAVDNASDLTHEAG